MLWWDRRSLAALAGMWPLEVTRFAREPLAAYHADWYSSLLPPPARMARRVIGGLLRRIGPVRRMITGHSIYVCYRKRT
jgi:hypothetical protein